MRNAITIPINEEQSIVIASDNSGAIGMKEFDTVKVPYETVGYYSFRVAVMECMAAGARPISVIIQNFCGDEAWHSLVLGVQRGIDELQMEGIQVTGSTESNFSLKQSAVGINVIGRTSTFSNALGDLRNKSIALIGFPLVGDEVINQKDQIVPLYIFRDLFKLKNVVVVWPVGSKGVLSELRRLIPGIAEKTTSTSVDLFKSGGPSTSFLVLFPSDIRNEIKNISGSYFHMIDFVK